MTSQDQQSRVLDALLQAVDEVNSILPGGQKLERSPQLLLHGPGSLLESITLINLLVAGEEKIAASLNRAAPLTVLVADADPERYRTLADLGRLATEALEVEE